MLEGIARYTWSQALTLMICAALASAAAPDRLDRIWRGNFSHRTSVAPSLKILDWNIERGLRFQSIAEAIEREQPDICLFQEVDLNAHRTRRRNVAEELARKFGLNYVFGAEFEELSQGSRDSPAFHGQAILTSLPIRSSRIVRFVHQSEYWRPRWYRPNRPLFQPRLGGRMALVAELLVGDRVLVIYNAHLESRGSERRRALQLEEILFDANDYPLGTPIVVAGDLNTRSKASPVIRRLNQAAFSDAVGQDLASTRAGGGQLDWVFVRGPLVPECGRIHHEVTASDHYPLSVRLSLSRRGSP